MTYFIKFFKPKKQQNFEIVCFDNLLTLIWLGFSEQSVYLTTGLLFPTPKLHCEIC